MRTKFANRWTGWETSLRHYRIWMNSKTNNESEIQEEMEKSAIFHVGWFYPKIYYFHVFFVITILLIWLFVIHRLLVVYSDNILGYLVNIIGYEVNNAGYLANVITFIVMLIVSLYLLHYFFPLRSSQLEDRIERERAIWRLVYKEKDMKNTV